MLPSKNERNKRNGINERDLRTICNILQTVRLFPFLFSCLKKNLGFQIYTISFLLKVTMSSSKGFVIIKNKLGLMSGFGVETCATDYVLPLKKRLYVYKRFENS